MKIDLHCHTLKCKKGDSIKRNVSKDKFIYNLKEKGVEIVAVTNHNTFDRKQYDDFIDNDYVQVWPGVELDVQGNDGRGHCLLIVNPTFVNEFDLVMQNITIGKTADNFLIKIDELCDAFKDIDMIVIAHYHNKNPKLSDSDVEYLKSKLTNAIPFFVEVSNLRSAGIMIAHNINTIIGSDIQDWDNYLSNAIEIPELKLPIENFDKFSLLIKKDPIVINTFIDQKFSEVKKIKPFPDCELELKIYNDINIIFGGKGTGKSEILKKLKEEYDKTGNSDVSYYSAEAKSITYDKISSTSVKETDFAILSFEEKTSCFQFLKNWKEVNITSINKYLAWGKTKDNESLKKNFGFVNAVFSDVPNTNKFTDEYENFKGIKKNINELHKYLDGNYLDESEENHLKSLLEKLFETAKEKVINEFCIYHSLNLESKSIDDMKNIFKNKSGVSSKPSSTGLTLMFENCVNVYEKASNIYECLNSKKKIERKLLGSLHEKGNVFIFKYISVNPDEMDSSFEFLKGKSMITKLSNIKKSLNKVINNSFNLNITNELSSLVNLLEQDNISSIKDFLGVKGITCKEDGQEYKPSNGEQSMILLNNAILDDNKNVFILDEPEMSVGHKYINDVIVPKINMLAKLGKKIIISTHDANIAIRTLPFQSIYREDNGGKKYSTYIGSPFIDLMYNYEDKNDTRNWAKLSIDTLEGGKKAFIERGEAYGNEKN